MYLKKIFLITEENSFTGGIFKNRAEFGVFRLLMWAQNFLEN